MTLRLRLTLLYGGCFLVAGVVLLAITYALVARDTSGQTRALLLRGRVVSVSVGSGGQRRPVNPSSTTTPTPTTPTPTTTSPTTTSSASATTPAVAPARLTITANGAFAPGIRRRLRVLRARAQALIDGVTATANGNLKLQRRQTLASLLSWSGGALGVLSVLSVLFGWLLAGRALRPIAVMTARAREIGEDNLDARLAADVPENELGELARTFDGVLDRLALAFEGQKRFVANASHELRTPLTFERTLLEVALADPQASEASLRAACVRAVESTAEQERMIEALLMLARSQHQQLRGERLDLAPMLADTLEERELRLDGITVTRDLQPAPVDGDQALIERLAANLIDNAILHNAAAERWIDVRTESGADGSRLSVGNSGAQIPDEAIERLFEPFRRLNTDRTSSDGGVGLGLSIVRAVAVAHGGSVVARPLPGGGLLVTVTFPVAADTSV